MAKILWVSDLVLETGFSRVSHSLLEHLIDSYDIVGFGINYMGDPHKFPFPIYPAFSQTVYGFDKLPKVVAKEKPDIIFILNDAFVQDKYLAYLKSAKVDVPIVTYTPVDGENHNPEWYENFDIVSKVVTYTEFGKRVMGSVIGDKVIHVIPHGVNKNFHKIDEDIKVLRERFFKTDKFNDAFIFLNANRNQPRKRLDITMMAFKEFSEGKDNAYLYMHCGIVDASINVLQLAKYLGIEKKLIYSNTSVGVQQVSIEDLNMIYNITDAGVNTAWGEGWGLVGVEHLSCGKPQIAPLHSAFPEALGDGAIYVEPVMDYIVDNTNIHGKLVHPSGVARAMEMLYSNKEIYDEVSKKGLEYVTQEKFKWENIAKEFDKLFKEVL